MPKELYNEGRVVGYSAYEEYLKHSLSENPNIEPASEREWLASTLGNGTSMLLKVRADVMHNELHYIDYPLPETSLLGSANTIVGTLFLGQAECDEIGWATKITDYGAGISNTAVTSPSTTDDATDYESFTLKSWIEDKGSHKENFKTTPTYQYTVNDGYESNTVSYDNVDGKSKPAEELMQYLKIQDGLILQPGDWFTTDSGNPYKDMAPNNLEVPVVRLVFANVIKSDFYLLLTAFADRKVLTGISGLDGSTDTDKPQNGDFLGPAVYPWANKIVFTYPPSAEYYLRKSMYSRYNNLDINQDDEKLGIEFVSSHIIADEGVSVCGPSEPGGDIKISSRIRNDSNNYIKVTHGALNKEDCIKSGSIDSSEHQTDEHYTTSIEHGQIYVDRGIAIRLPQHPGEDIYISNKIQSTNNMVKIEQRRLPNLNKSNLPTVNLNDTEFSVNKVNLNVDFDTSTKITISQVVPNIYQGLSKNSGITVIQPSSPGDDVKLQVIPWSYDQKALSTGPIEGAGAWTDNTDLFGNPFPVPKDSNSLGFWVKRYRGDGQSSYWGDSENKEKYEEQISKDPNLIHRDEYGKGITSSTINLGYPTKNGDGYIMVDRHLPHDLVIGLDFNKLSKDLVSLSTGSNSGLQYILNEIVTRLNGSINSDGSISWHIPGNATIGNMNIYSSDGKSILGHKNPATPGDLQVN